MTAHTAFDRSPSRVRRHSAADVVPLPERAWIRLAALAIVVSWVLGCVFASALLTK